MIVKCYLLHWWKLTKCCNLVEISAKKIWVIRPMLCPFTSSIWAGLTLSSFLFTYLFIYFYYLQSALRMIHLTDQNSQRTNLHYVGLKIELNKSQFCEPIVNRLEKSIFQQITQMSLAIHPYMLCSESGIWNLNRSQTTLHKLQFVGRTASEPWGEVWFMADWQPQCFISLVWKNCPFQGGEWKHS